MDHPPLDAENRLASSSRASRGLASVPQPGGAMRAPRLRHRDMLVHITWGEFYG